MRLRRGTCSNGQSGILSTEETLREAGGMIEKVFRED